MAKKKVTAPKSLKVSRSKNKYTFSWTRGEKYSKDQKLEYIVDRKKKKDKWKSVNITKTTTKYSIKSKATNVDKIEFKVRGVSGGKNSSWSNQTFNISKPNNPKVNVELVDNNATKFIYEVKDEEKKPVYWMEWQSILSKSGDTPDLKKDWKKFKNKTDYRDYSKGNNGDKKNKYMFRSSGKKEFKEDFTTGWVRHFKVRAVGAGGSSAWKSTKHAYNQPNAATNVTFENVVEKNGFITMLVSWNTADNKAKPVTQSIVQYYIGKYGENLAPSNGQWQDAIGGTTKDIKKDQTADIKIEGVVEIDQCLWIRVLNVYDSFKVESDSVLVLSKRLSKPTISEITYDSETFRASITATNTTEAYKPLLIARYYDSDSSSASGKDIGILQSGQATTIQCPDWTGHYPIRFGIRSILGSIESVTLDRNEDSNITGYILTTDTTIEPNKQYYEAVEEDEDSDLYPEPVDLRDVDPELDPSEEEYYETKLFKLSEDTTVDSSKSYYEKDGLYFVELAVPETGENPKEQGYLELVTDSIWYNTYTFDTIEYSEEATEGGATPIAPQKVNAFQIGTTGTIQVTWENSWDAATGAEIAWADHDDALYSTDQPSTFTVSNIKQSKLNIAGLELGKIWYVWVRLYSTNESGNNIYSEYSSVRSVNLSSAPAIPNFDISPSTVANTDDDNGIFKCSWNYVSTDGTDQASAAIYEVIEVEGQDPIYKPFYTNISTERFVDFRVKDILDQNLDGWTIGTMHNLAIQVKSDGGVNSGYSAAVPISIADPIDIAVTSTSLVDELNPITYTGTTISEDIDDYKDVHNAEVTLPYNSSKYYSISMTQVADDTTETMDVTFGTEESYPEVDPFYGGTYNFMTGILTSLYTASGNLRTNPEVYNIYKSDLTIIPAVTNTFTTDGYSFSSVASPQLADIDSYYELNSDNVYFSTEDTEIDSTKTYYHLVVVQSQLQQSIRVADNDTYHKVLTDLPLVINVNNISEQETISVGIYRENNFVAPMPNENVFIGYENENVFLGNYENGDQISIDLPGYVEDAPALSQKLDDTGEYILRIVASDDFGQVSEPIEIPFVVSWTNQAVEPEATVEIVNNSYAKIDIVQPTLDPSSEHDFTGDTIDIYRLSGDDPRLIYSGAEFGESYVDPYPTIGSRGGYRIVLTTRNGDYITSDSTPAWIDLEGYINSKFQFIDFGGRHIDFIYNVDLDNSWNKNFTLTHYLGGSIQGDWLAGVERSSNVKGVTFDDIEPDTYDLLRDLAAYTGICHVRTIEGSNYTANVTVNDNTGYNRLAHQHDISLSIQECENPTLDGMTLSDWNDIISNEE